MKNYDSWKLDCPDEFYYCDNCDEKHEGDPIEMKDKFVCEKCYLKLLEKGYNINDVEKEE